MNNYNSVYLDQSPEVLRKTKVVQETLEELKKAYCHEESKRPISA